MSKPFVIATAVVALLSTSALAQTQPPGGVQVAPLPSNPTGAGPNAVGSPATEPATTAAAPVGMAPAAEVGTLSSTQFMPMQDAGHLLANDLIGTEVRNNQDESLGSVSDLVMSENGELQGVVIGVGGFLGIGDRDVAVRWNALNVNRGERGDFQLKLDAGREQLEKAPEFKTRSQQQAEAAARAPQPAAAPGGAVVTSPVPGAVGAGTMAPASGTPAPAR